MTRVATLRSQLGACVHELPIALWGLRPTGSRSAWLAVRNRAERLVPGPGVPGLRCDWRWTSSLHVNRVFPRVGRALLRRGLRHWPIGLDERPGESAAPEVTFIIGHRGPTREAQLRLTLASIAAQRDAAIECVVVEQSNEAELRGTLPSWVRYEHTPLPHADMPYNRSWALNVGARLARGDLLVLHDGDMLAPRDYAAELLRQAAAGYEVLNLKRFIFYLGPDASCALAGAGLPALEAPAEDVVQNLEAGGSLAVTARAFAELGGFDEAFVGWGGEDNDFWERAQTRTVYPWGYLPLLHLWHAPQPGKGAGLQAAAVARHHALAERPVRDRIAELRARLRGRVSGPTPPHRPDGV